MRVLALIAALMIVAGPAAAKLGTGTPRHWLGFQFAYGATLLGAQHCENKGEQADCLVLLGQALKDVEVWNTCLDKVMFSHGINIMWPVETKRDYRYLAQMDYRAMMIEDLIAQGSYTNELMGTCLPDKNIVMP